MSPVVYFVIGLLAFLFGFGFFIAFLATRLNHNVSHRVYGRVEQAIIGGIVLGIVAMFQPWTVDALEPGFLLLLVATLAYIAWSHITPLPESFEEETQPS